MSVIVNDGGIKSYIKGAPEILIRKCKYIKLNNQIIPFSEEIKDKIKGINDEMTDRALRVIALCYKNFDEFNPNDEIEEDMFSVVKSVFSNFSLIIHGDTNAVKTINHEITKRAINMLLDGYRYCEQQGMTKSVYEIAVKAIATGTIEEFQQYTDNAYIKTIIEEIRNGE